MRHTTDQLFRYSGKHNGNTRSDGCAVVRPNFKIASYAIAPTQNCALRNVPTDSKFSVLRVLRVLRVRPNRVLREDGRGYGREKGASFAAAETYIVVFKPSTSVTKAICKVCLVYTCNTT